MKHQIYRREFLAAAMAPAVASAAAASRIRVGCQTRAYGSPIRDRAKLLAVLDDLRETGYEGFETNFRSLESSFPNPAPVRAEIEKRGVPLIGLHMGAKLYEPAAIAAEQEQIRKVAGAVAALGGTHLMLSVHALPKGAAGEARKRVFARRSAQLNRTGRMCQSLGLRLAVHNHGQQAANNGAEIREILRSTDPAAVWLCFDAAHAQGAGMQVLPFVREYAGRITALHLRDVRGDKEVEMGAGEFDFRGLGRLLAEKRWTGWAIVEINRVAGVSSRERVRKARLHLRKTMGI